ncbi:MAG: sugar phosphate isomerase/epimerase [Clostridiales bacterium]|nr:sugar phosphate isomerase/epimerase [Clostridiales bacterium]
MIKGKKIGFFANGSFRRLPLADACAALKKIGYDAVELDMDWIDRCGAAETVKTVADSGLILSEIMVQHDYIDRDPAAREAMIALSEENIRRCAGAGIKIFNLFTGPRPWMPGAITVGEDMSMGEAWGMVLAAFDRLVPLAEKLGVQLAVENVWGMLCHDFYTASYLINYYDSPNLGVNLDPSHDQLAGNTDMGFIVRGWGRERIKHIHLKDAAGSQKKGQVTFPPIGEGYVDWNGFFGAIDDIGYDEVLSVEYEADGRLNRGLGGDWVRAAEETYKTLLDIV